MAHMKVILVLSLLLIITMAESRFTIPHGKGNGKGESTPSVACTSVHGAQIGDTCFSVARQFKLTAQAFSAINPNLVCDSIFEGQWLCVAGSVSP